MNCSEKVIQFASVVASFVAAFQSLGYNTNLNSSSLLTRAERMLQLNFKEPWWFQTMETNLLRPTLLHFNFCIQEKTPAQNRMTSNSKCKPDPSVATSANPKTI